MDHNEECKIRLLKYNVIENELFIESFLIEKINDDQSKSSISVINIDKLEDLIKHNSLEKTLSIINKELYKPHNSLENSKIISFKNYFIYSKSFIKNIVKLSFNIGIIILCIIWFVLSFVDIEIKFDTPYKIVKRISEYISNNTLNESIITGIYSFILLAIPVQLYRKSKHIILNFMKIIKINDNKKVETKEEHDVIF
ncbi:Uncharacterised protein [[Clostridium] sordellii]|uniref:hypothetical protein n=1 Tax=Paraclostridium sordellii TaxID=1505 RepID=UPI0005DF87E9|nr:hypothetical protein [Paeniclostridium sordellii]CEP95522.1 Uncharacterised protein [[Clostridium] sordellii] [Paeniclostridium sordellii]